MKLMEILIEHAKNKEFTGIKLLDAYIADGIDETRMILPFEKDELKRIVEQKEKITDKKAA